jgi:hypothetical protein
MDCEAEEDMQVEEDVVQLESSLENNPEGMDNERPGVTASDIAFMHKQEDEEVLPYCKKYFVGAGDKEDGTSWAENPNILNGLSLDADAKLTFALTYTMPGIEKGGESKIATTRAIRVWLDRATT